MKKKYLALLTVAATLSFATSAFALSGTNTVDSGDIIDQEVKTADLADLGVTTAKLAAGAVTDAKITGPISASKIAVGNVVVVAKSGGQYTSPTAALAAITNASATNPYLVKIMPGIYDLGGASLQMKAYVDVEGAGDSVTTLTSTVSTTGWDNCTVGTVNMANNSVLRNIKVGNTGSVGAGNVITGIAFNNVQAKADGVAVLVGADNVYNWRSVGICATGAESLAILDRVKSEAHDLDGMPTAVMAVTDASLKITNSNLKGVSAGSGAPTVVDAVSSVAGTGAVTISDSAISIDAPVDADGALVYGDNYTIRIAHSTFTTNGNYTHSLSVWDGVTTISNSQFYNNQAGIESLTINGSDPVKIRIANSLFQGGLVGTTNVTDYRLFNNTNENLDPIANQ